MLTKSLVLAAALVGATTAGAVTVTRTYEAPGVQNTTARFTSVAVETFDGRQGVSNFSTFGGGTGITGKFANVRTYSADVYGGAGGAGRYAVLFQGDAATTLDVSTADPKGVNYLGFWLSALNGGNTVTFFKGGSQIASFDASDIFNGISNLNAYRGNPNAPFLGGNGREPYAFVNFSFVGGSFDRVVFRQTAGGGLEFDNVTVGTAVVPEPTTWLLMIAGFGLVGVAMRRKARMARVPA